MFIPVNYSLRTGCYEHGPQMFAKVKSSQLVTNCVMQYSACGRLRNYLEAGDRRQETGELSMIVRQRQSQEARIVCSLDRSSLRNGAQSTPGKQRGIAALADASSIFRQKPAQQLVIGRTSSHPPGRKWRTSPRWRDWIVESAIS